MASKILIIYAWKFNISSMFSTEFQVMDGAYDGAKLSSTSQAVLSENSLDKNKGYSIPLEIKPSGQFEPLYRTTLSVQVLSCSQLSTYNFTQKKFFFFSFFLYYFLYMEGWRIAGFTSVCVWSSCHGT